MSDQSSQFEALCRTMAGRSDLAFLLDRSINFDAIQRAWLPLAIDLAHARAASDRPIIQGILGVQGVGKTTLCTVLVLALELLGLKAVSWSIDDLYKTYADRLTLQTQDPRLIWRGPPGTHDVALGIEILQRLRSPDGSPIPIPRFDKSLHGGQGDRVAPDWIEPVDIVLFEGWFVGTRPIDCDAIVTWPDPINSAADRAFARDCNDRLREYLPLWDLCDRLLILKPTDYRLSKTWRKQAERDRIAAGGAGFSDAEIDAFVDYFWKSLHPTLFIDPLVYGSSVDRVFEFGANRQLQWPIPRTNSRD
ncbi:MAG TPA: glycerate kinase [Coleofasciculaceae cyanobacterium]